MWKCTGRETERIVHAQGVSGMSVNVWSEKVMIPTYHVGKPNKNPMFLEKRVYQGSSGAVYPHPVIDRVDHEKQDREWTAVFLENDFIKLMILPELGGRVHMALDKTNDYPFVYHNHVIKPALVGLTGPWISGGIEFNWPQHHRPSTYEPVDWSMEKHADGRCTVWCAEHEVMFRMRGIHGFTVYPDRASFDVRVRLHNTTREPQTFLWWANPAVHVNEDYQSVFPPDVHAVMDHGKRDVSAFPIAKGIYYKHNYAPGTDISRYKNIPVPTSYMAYHSDYDFVGCYDHGCSAGMLHVANHHVVPGKKQWTWGHGDFGRAWDRQLTDGDGPYIELMCGAFTDNQPDFTWLMPGEEKRFVQTFMPYKHIGPAHQANRDWVLNLEIADSTARLGIYAVRDGAAHVELWFNPDQAPPFHNHKNMQLKSMNPPLGSKAEKLYTHNLDLKAAQAWTQQIPLPRACQHPEITVRLVSNERKTVLLSYTPPSDEKPAIPSPAQAAPAPAEVASNEALYLHGLHLEQYRHATYAPEPYYEEALRRDPGDVRCNQAMGLLLLRRGKFMEAERYFRNAIERLTSRNPNPYDGEPYYHLGLSLKFQERYEEAFDVFYKAVWSEAWKAPAFFELAQLASRAGRWGEALELLDECLVRNGRHVKALHLKATLQRRLNDPDAQAVTIKRLEEIDPLHAGAACERAGAWDDRVGDLGYAGLEVALDYMHAGLYEEAETLFAHARDISCMALYYEAACCFARGAQDAGRERLRHAAAQPFAYAFPNQLECVPVLSQALAMNPHDALASYALGNFWYAHRRYAEAIACWEQCTQNQPSFPTAWRNLGLAYMNKLRDPAKAEQSLEKAFIADPSDARVLYELDQLRKETGVSAQERLAYLDAHRDLVLERDDVCVEYATLLNECGRAEETMGILTRRIFHPWEGGEGKSVAQYVRARIAMAKKAAQSGQNDVAWAHLEAAEQIPANLNEGKLEGNRENELRYEQGCVLASMGRRQEAVHCFQAATEGVHEPASAQYYNDQPPESIYFQGLAWIKLGEPDKAKRLFQKLIDYAQQHKDEAVTMDYFAVSLPEFMVFEIDLAKRHRLHCEKMKQLGERGLARLAEESKDDTLVGPK
jgi:tetratricopeptide (TPR) repeat protein